MGVCGQHILYMYSLVPTNPHIANPFWSYMYQMYTTSKACVEWMFHFTLRIKASDIECTIEMKRIIISKDHSTKSGWTKLAVLLLRNRLKIYA